ncbi:hypothetical protein [Flavobacterium sp. PS2]|uniref:hypothetical protein n=1 Tax=Flavobacterium sp. PS2 TaxID=3384157 RepID=UPI00390C7132
MIATRNIKIQECLLNIDMLCRSMYLSQEESVDLKIPINSNIYADLIRYSYIKLCTILDEFEILNGIAKNDEYLRDTLYIISPVMKALRQYTGIKRARNYMLAHFNRDKKRNFLPWWIAMKNLKLPRTHAEIEDIYKHLHLMNAFIVARYYEELEDISKRVKPDFDSYGEWMREQELINSEKSEFDLIANEVQKRLVEKGIADQLIIDPVMTKVIERINKQRTS